MPIFIKVITTLLLLGSSRLWAFDHSHQLWDELVAAYVNKAGLVNYDGLKKKHEPKLHAYLAQLEEVLAPAYESWTPTQKKAFLINAYNAYTVALILAHYNGGRLSSITEIGGNGFWGAFATTWQREFFKLLPPQKDSSSYLCKSLDCIEHETLRKFKPAFRIHAGVNCASLSCPALRQRAYTAENLDQQLDEQWRLWLADPSKNYYNPQEKVLYVSKIFDWYKADFEPYGGVEEIFKQYGPAPLKKMLNQQPLEIKIKFAPYNWQLNKQ